MATRGGIVQCGHAVQAACREGLRGLSEQASDELRAGRLEALRRSEMQRSLACHGLPEDCLANPGPPGQLLAQHAVAALRRVVQGGAALAVLSHAFISKDRALQQRTANGQMPSLRRPVQRGPALEVAPPRRAELLQAQHESADSCMSGLRRHVQDGHAEIRVLVEHAQVRVLRKGLEHRRVAVDGAEMRRSHALKVPGVGAVEVFALD
mmetsp:Transcript_63930/g.190528  ORF Transcript_63930/g.190528 Transcript_63930/m.190528 type:complete len:209 (-) Transcript_63930:670-1296(-)